jgi:hypothetical protein
MAAGSNPFGGSNQWGNFPSLNTNFIRNIGDAGGFSGGSGYGGGAGGSGNPATPLFGGTGGSTNPWNFNYTLNSTPNQMLGARNLGSGIYSEPVAFPGLTSNWLNFLSQNIGQGVQANPLLQQLLTGFTGGQTNIPGFSTLETIANQGISALPEWQAMIGAQQQNIAQNQANLAGQFAAQGTGAGSPFGTAMSDYMSQTTANQNALLGQLQQQNILQGQIPVAQGLMGGAEQFGQFAQSLLPQYNPMNQFLQQASLYTSPMYQTKKGGGILGGLSGLLGPALGAVGGIGGDIAQGLAGGGGITDVISSLAGGGAASGVLSSILAGLMAI